MAERKEIHERVLNAQSKEELAAAYGEWAKRYDSDLLDEMGYVAPFLATGVFREVVTDTGARILDAGCGTGIVGRLLNEHGYNTIEGLDYSEEMLEVAANKGAYTHLHQADLTKKTDLLDDAYDAVISVGTFTLGHVGPDSLPELIRVTKKDGHICFTVREEAWHEHEYGRKLADLEKRGRWTEVKQVEADYIRQDESKCRICVYQVAV